MRDIFSYYASITSDPYNFSRVEIVRGPASVLFGQGSIGGIVNLVSKTPDFTTRGEINLVYGSYDRKEVLGDVNLRSEEHTSELPSLMRISYAVFCLKKKNKKT